MKIVNHHFCKIPIIILSVIWLSGCSTGNSEELIQINTQKKYPVLNLKLSDVAEVKYIPLKYGEDSVIITNQSPRGFFIHKDTILLCNYTYSAPQIVLYDILGNSLLKIDKRGGGPGEYINIDFVTDTVRKEIFVWDNELKKMIIYDFNGKYKKEKRLKNDFLYMADLNERYLLGYNFNSRQVHSKKNKVFSTGLKTLLLINKDTLSARSYSDFDYIKPNSPKSLIISTYLTIAKNGIYITNDRSDTIWFMNRNLKISPKIVDITPYKTKESQVFPTIETDEYIFLKNEQDHFKQPFEPDKNRYYAYDKKQNKIYRLQIDYYKDQPSFALVFDQIALGQGNITQNYNYAETWLWPPLLHKYRNILPPELKSIADTLKEDDNPVLMLIRFKD